jgi:hypothetical protein
MRSCTRLLLALALTSSLAGCFVVAHPAHGTRQQGVADRDCPPAHHWEDGACVHNGKAKGLHKHGRD